MTDMSESCDGCIYFEGDVCALLNVPPSYVFYVGACGRVDDDSCENSNEDLTTH